MSGAGTSYIKAPAAVDAETVVSDGLDAILAAESEGDFVVSDGAGGTQFASDDAAAVRGIIGAGTSSYTPPTASAAGELLRSTAAGTTYAAVPQSDVVTESLEAMIGGEPVGSAVISDGAGGVRTVDPNVAPVLAATSLALARTALAVQDGPRVLPLGDYTTTTSTVDVAVGGGYFAPAGYAITGRTTVLTLEAVGEVVSGVTGTITLRNLTDATDDATLSWTETSATRKSASVALPASAKVYELRFKKSGGAADDYAVLLAANLLVTWS